MALSGDMVWHELKTTKTVLIRVFFVGSFFFCPMHAHGGCFKAVDSK
jgi:hypothetical protein